MTSEAVIGLMICAGILFGIVALIASDVGQLVITVFGSFGVLGWISLIALTFLMIASGMAYLIIIIGIVVWIMGIISPGE